MFALFEFDDGAVNDFPQSLSDDRSVNPAASRSQTLTPLAGAREAKRTKMSRIKPTPTLASQIKAKGARPASKMSRKKRPRTTSPSSSSLQPQNPIPPSLIPPSPPTQLRLLDEQISVANTMASNTSSLADLYDAPPSLSKSGLILRSTLSTATKERDAMIAREKSLASLGANNPKKMIVLQTAKPMMGGKPHMPNLMSECDVLKLIILRERYLQMTISLVKELEDLYENYMEIKRRKFLEKKSSKNRRAETQKRIQVLLLTIKQGQKKLELFIAQLRAISVEVVEEIVKWQNDLRELRNGYDATFASTRGRAQKGAMQAPFFWHNPDTDIDENYLLKMRSDCNFINEGSIVGEWVGFKINPFFIPPNDLNVEKSLNERRATMRANILKKRAIAAQERATEVRKSMQKVVGGMRAVTIFKLGGGKKRFRATAIGTSNRSPNGSPDSHASGSPPRRRARNTFDPLSLDETVPKKKNQHKHFATADAFTAAGRQDKRETSVRTANTSDLLALSTKIMADIDNDSKTVGDDDTISKKSNNFGSPTTTAFNDDIEDEDILSEGEEEELKFPDVIPERQLVRQLRPQIIERCEIAADVIQNEVDVQYFRTLQKDNSVKNRTLTSGILTKYADNNNMTMTMSLEPLTSLASRSTSINFSDNRPSTSSGFFKGTRGGILASDDDDDVDNTFMTTQTTMGRPSTAIGLPPVRQNARRNSNRISEVFASSRPPSSGFPRSIQGSLLVSNNSRAPRFYRLSKSQAITIIQGFARLIIARQNVLELMEYRERLNAATKLQKLIRGKKCRQDFFLKLRNHKASDMRARIEQREIARSAKILQRFFDNVLAQKKEKWQAEIEKRRFNQEKSWIKRAVMDASVFQIQRVWRRYVAIKRDIEYRELIKFNAARSLQGMIRMKMSKKKVQAEKLEKKENELVDQIVLTAEEAVIIIQCFARKIFANRRVNRRRTKNKNAWLANQERARRKSIYTNDGVGAEGSAKNNKKGKIGRRGKNSKNDMLAVESKAAQQDKMNRVTSNAIEAADLANFSDTDSDFSNDKFD